MKKTIVYFVSEDWYFYSHRLPVARIALKNGLRVVVVTNVNKHMDLIKSEGDISFTEMNRVFNLGLGMIALCDSSNVDYILKSIPNSKLVGETIASSESEILI